MWPALRIACSALTSWLSSAGTSLAIARAELAALPKECCTSVGHAFSVCIGGSGTMLSVPGLGPVVVCWGWALLAFVFGVFVGGCVCGGLVLYVRSSSCSSCWWLPLVDEALLVCQDAHLKNVLAFVRSSPSALEELANDAGLEPHVLLHRVLLQAGGRAETGRGTTRQARRNFQ